MNLISIGISHHTAPVDIRERMWFSDAEAKDALPRLKEGLFTECVLVSTCNRTELYGIAVGAHVTDAALVNRLVDAKGVREIVRPDHFVGRVSEEAVLQLFRVVSGIDSMVLGDIQIQNQVKEAFTFAREAGAVGTILNRLMQSGLHVGKRTRAETSIGEGAVSVSYAAVELAGKIFADLSTKSALLIGAGETGELTLKHLTSKGVRQVSIANRTREKAEALVRELGGTVVDYDRMHDAIASVDMVLTSVSAPAHILGPADLRKVMRARSNRPLFIIDIGVPRNVDPTARKIENIFLYDIDSLHQIIDRNLERRKAEIPRVNAIIQEEAADFFRWYHSLQVGPTIQDLHATFENVRRMEVEKNINRFRTEDRELVELVTRRIINKLLHDPVTALKKGAEDESEASETLTRIAVLRHLFGIGRTNGDRRGD
jgi:glutamyl-tRNA reductase